LASRLYPEGRVCDAKPVRQDELDLVVWQQVSALLADPSLIEVELERRLAELRQGDPARNQRARLERELARVTTATRRLVEAYQEELLTLDELRGRMPELRKKEVSLRTQLDTLDAQIIDRDSCLALADDLASFLARLHQAAQSSSVPDRQRGAAIAGQGSPRRPRSHPGPALHPELQMGAPARFVVAWEESSLRPGARGT